MRFTLRHGLAAAPGLLMLVGVPFANRVHALVLGLPFLLVWMVACVLLTSVTLAWIGRLDARDVEAKKRGADRENPR